MTHSNLPEKTVKRHSKRTSPDLENKGSLVLKPDNEALDDRLLNGRMPQVNAKSPISFSAPISTFASAFTMLLDRRAEWQARMKMAREAEHFLYISTYYLEFDDYGKEFLDALDQAVRRRVRVTLIIDAFGQWLTRAIMTKAAHEELHRRLQQLRNTGATVLIYRPQRRLQNWLGSGYHIKIQVSEKGEAIFGSSNISQMSFEKWMEFSVAVRGKLSAVMLADLMQILEAPERDDLELLQGLARAEQTKKQIQFKYHTFNPCCDSSLFSPFLQRDENTLTTKLINAIEQAKTSVLLTSFYYKPVPSLFRAVVAAARRGVQIEIHHSHREALEATNLAWLAAAARYRPMLKNEIVIHEHLQGQHTKFVLIDDKIAWLGSYNFEWAAHDRLAEAMLETSDECVVEEIRRFFATLRDDPENILLPADGLAQVPGRLRPQRQLCKLVKRWL